MHTLHHRAFRTPFLVAALLAVLASPSWAEGAFHVEGDDAGDPLRPQATGSATVHGELMTITGTLSASDLVDTYCVVVTDATSFQATTNPNDGGLASAAFDTDLFLFDTEGYGYMANDNSPSGGSGSLLAAPSKFPGAVLGAPIAPADGQRMLLSISSSPLDPVDAMEQMVFDTTTDLDALHGSTGQIAAGWEIGSITGGAYVIELTGAETCGPNLAFLTAEDGTGDLSSWSSSGGESGLLAADEICRQQAADAGLPQADQFVAWLSSSADDAACRVQGLGDKTIFDCGLPGPPPAIAGPWVDVQGRPVFESLADLIQDEVYRPIQAGPAGEVLPIASYWTGSNFAGELRQSTPCGDWSQESDVAGVGVSYATTRLWSFGGTRSCSDQARLLCLQVGAGIPVQVEPVASHRLVFATSVAGTGDLASWPQAGGAAGLAAGDAICRELATDAGLPRPEGFVAWLSDGASSAIDRITSDDPWYRIDGVRFAASKAVLTAAQRETSISVDELGNYLEPEDLFTGTHSNGTKASDHCAGWTSATGSAVKGSTSYVDANWTDGLLPYDCASPTRLICLNDLPSTVFTDGFESGTTTQWSAEAP